MGVDGKNFGKKNYISVVYGLPIVNQVWEASGKSKYDTRKTRQKKLATIKLTKWRFHSMEYWVETPYYWG